MQLIKSVKDFDLKNIFDCGQCFRWNEEEDGSYTGTAFGRTVNMSFEPDCEGGCSGRLIIDGADEEDFENIWKKYLDLDRDYSFIKETLGNRDEVIKEAICKGEGIRLLNQDNWETLISFIVSQNNNIPRIKKCIEGLCEKFGEELPEYRGKKRYAFPGYDVLSKVTLEDLADIKLGYRAEYIIRTAQTVAEDEGRMLYALNSMPLKDAYDYLVSLQGVGPKVANCILLFAIEKYESFPIDVWMRRVMNYLYGFPENDMKGMAAFARETYGENGGFAQQYLFYYMREITL
ncbi:MAG: 8-oxoguanine DNA glycosylase [Clostridiales bacterium]|nr:8-oxoguanine DNA glycosylase [Clostridiales bacterium]